MLKNSKNIEFCIMASKPKGQSLEKIKHLVAGATGWAQKTLINVLKSPVSWASVFWDGYVADEFPDHVMRFMKVFVGLAFIIRLVSGAFVGLFLAIDGLYSIYRHRFELAVTQNWREDVPRIARCLLGIVLLAGFT